MKNEKDMKVAVNRQMLAKLTASKVEGGTKRDALIYQEAMWEVIMEQIKKGNDVHVVGVIEFESKDVPERIMTNPMNGEEITCEPSKKVVIRAKSRFNNFIKDRL